MTCPCCGSPRQAMHLLDRLQKRKKLLHACGRSILNHVWLKLQRKRLSAGQKIFQNTWMDCERPAYRSE